MTPISYVQSRAGSSARSGAPARSVEPEITRSRSAVASSRKGRDSALNGLRGLAGSPPGPGPDSLRSSCRGAGELGEATAEPAEDEQVEEVHAAEQQQHSSDLAGQGFDGIPEVGDLVAELEDEGDVPQVDEVEADPEQVVHGVGQLDLAAEHVHQED